MIKVKWYENDAIQEFFMRHYLSKYGTGQLTQYLMRHGFPHVPYFEFDIRVKYDEEVVKEISVFIVADLDFVVEKDYDADLRNAISDFFKERGYPVGLGIITDEVELVQFIHTLKKEGFKTEDYFEITTD